MTVDTELVGCAPRLELEAQRLALLHYLQLLDTPAEAVFDAITRLAAQLTERPIALIGLADADRIWFKSRVGLHAAQSPRDISFCGFAIASTDIFEVPDSRADPRFAASPLVTGYPNVQSYAGMPLRVAGLPMGTVCVVGHEPSALTPSQRGGLRDLGRVATELLEQRLASLGKSYFIGRMNHEIRIPMNAILGFSQLLEMELEPASPPAKKVHHILVAGRHLLEIINESLQLIELESGTVQPSEADFDLTPLLDDLCQLLTPLAQARSIRLQQQLPVSLILRSDARRTRQVLANLLSNAIKYSRQGAQVTVSAGNELCADGVDTWVAVQDEGPGLTAQQIGRLFKPFERLGQERGAVEGTGLGLTLSQRLVQTMGAYIEVESKPGTGSTFRVRWGAWSNGSGGVQNGVVPTDDQAVRARTQVGAR